MHTQMKWIPKSTRSTPSAALSQEAIWMNRINLDLQRLCCASETDQRSFHEWTNWVRHRKRRRVRVRVSSNRRGFLIWIAMALYKMMVCFLDWQGKELDHRCDIRAWKWAVSYQTQSLVEGVSTLQRLWGTTTSKIEENLEIISDGSWLDPVKCYTRLNDTVIYKFKYAISDCIKIIN